MSVIECLNKLENIPNINGKRIVMRGNAPSKHWAECADEIVKEATITRRRIILTIG